MLTTKRETPKEISFFDACRLNQVDGSDICDNDWDWGIFLSCPDESDIDELDEAYDKFCLILCLNLKCKGIVHNWYTPCDVAHFIEEHRKAFDRFMDEENKEGYRPKDYDKPLKWDEDGGYLEVYMGTMENLIAGNYCESDYAKLIQYLMEE